MNITTRYCAKLLLESPEDYTRIDLVFNSQSGKGQIDNSCIISEIDICGSCKDHFK